MVSIIYIGGDSDVEVILNHRESTRENIKKRVIWVRYNATWELVLSLTKNAIQILNNY
jgi:hypothetical protein